MSLASWRPGLPCFACPVDRNRGARDLSRDGGGRVRDELRVSPSRWP